MSIFDLAGKTAIITGSSKGIGRAIAEQLAAFGANVVVSSRKAPACEEVVAGITAAGGKYFTDATAENNWGISRGGAIIHEVGAARMGADPKTSVLNPHCQAWDCKNLFVTDAAPFVSNADKNPTLTITALGWRTSEHIAEQVKKRNL